MDGAVWFSLRKMRLSISFRLCYEKGQFVSLDYTNWRINVIHLSERNLKDVEKKIQ
jgi:hypothetical protein